MREVQIDLLLKDIILKLVSYLTPTKTTKKGRPFKCSNETYLDAMFYVLKEGIGWNYLKGLPIKGDTVRRKFYEWNKLNVFELAWQILLDIYQHFKFDFKLLFIDASHIKNFMGVDKTGSNVYDRFRKATKFTIITDDLGTPVSIKLGPSNNHDVTFALSSVESIKVDISTTEYLVGDKGYVSRNLRSSLINRYKMGLITPRKRKKGQKGKIRGRKPNGHEHLKKRFIVEHSFSWFKHYTRLFRRKDKLINNFAGFVFFGAANIVASKIVKYIVN